MYQTFIELSLTLIHVSVFLFMDLLRFEHNHFVQKRNALSLHKKESSKIQYLRMANYFLLLRIDVIFKAEKMKSSVLNFTLSAFI